MLRNWAEALNHCAGSWLKPSRNPTEFLKMPYPEPLTDLEMRAALEDALRLTFTARQTCVSPCDGCKGFQASDKG